MITRAEYMQESHEEFVAGLDGTLGAFRRFYGQFVTEPVINYVLLCIGAEAILASTDRHFNDIPIHRWDRLAPPVDWRVLTEANGFSGNSLADTVCITKEAARIWKERQRTEEA